MTDELLKLASDKIEYHTLKYGYSKPNVKFVKGYMEKLEEAGLDDNYVDVIVSNCVISLCRDKKAVLREAYRALKPGGELYFSDMYRDGVLPSDVLDDEIMWCEGLIGALTYKELHAIAEELGFSVPRIVRADLMPVLDEGIKQRLGNVRYASVSYRLFKKSNMANLSVTSEAIYNGQIKGFEDELKFDALYTFKAGKRVAIDDILAEILTTSRFSKYFEVKQAKEDPQELPNLDIDPFAYIEKSLSKSACSGSKSCCA
ncbi:arsenite methyltransferase-like isoform X2 [Physella acuta]|nr:arsenite methyltransferase-like isoform X2 [Physella acuta]